MMKRFTGPLEQHFCHFERIVGNQNRTKLAHIVWLVQFDHNPFLTLVILGLSIHHNRHHLKGYFHLSVLFSNLCSAQ